MILPTRRAILALAAVAPVGLLGYATPAALDAVLVLDAIIILLVWIDAVRAPDPGRLELQRSAPSAFTRGHPGPLTYAWRNPANRPARLLVRETRPAVFGGVVAPRTIQVPAGSVGREEFSVTAIRRGQETSGWFAVRSIGPLGLGQRQERIDLPWEVMVFPSLPATKLRQSVAQAVRRREAGAWRLRRLGEGRLFESLREWVPGDDTRTIDWKASARRRKLIARQYEEERRQQVLLVIDAGRLLSEEISGTPRMEYVVRAATDLAFAASRHDDNVGVMVFSDQVEHYVAPQRGQRGLRQILRVLALVEPRLVESDYPAAFRYLAARNRKRALTVVFTDVIDRMASGALVSHIGSLRPRHLPLAVTLRNPELDAMATARPEVAAGAWRKAAAEEILHVRAEALGWMRRAGVLVLDVPPARAAGAVVKQYFELKRKGLV